MENEKPQPITWQQLKDFVDSIPEEQRKEIAYIIVEDASTALPLLEPFFQDEDIWQHKEAFEDCASLENRLVVKKGTPFLWAE